jgi:hypothetical protein
LPISQAKFSGLGAEQREYDKYRRDRAEHVSDDYVHGNLF